jgi:hypothetical protein
LRIGAFPELTAAGSTGRATEPCAD